MQDVLDRDKVVEVLKDIFGKCNLIEGKSIKLMPPDADSVLSKGYQIHIQTKCDQYTESCLQRIAKKYALATAIEDDFLVIYNPTKKKSVPQS